MRRVLILLIIVAQVMLIVDWIWQTYRIEWTLRGSPRLPVCSRFILKSRGCSNMSADAFGVERFFSV
jgi:hypothetical protein